MQIVSDENNSFAEAPGEGAELALEFGAGNGIKRAKGLVHQQDGRVGSEGAGDADALALAAGKFTRAAVGKFRWIKSNQGEEFPNAHGRAACVPAFQNGNESDIFCNRKMGKETSVLDDVTNSSAEAN